MKSLVTQSAKQRKRRWSRDMHNNCHKKDTIVRVPGRTLLIWFIFRTRVHQQN